MFCSNALQNFEACGTSLTLKTKKKMFGQNDDFGDLRLGSEREVRSLRKDQKSVKKGKVKGCPKNYLKKLGGPGKAEPEKKYFFLHLFFFR